MNPGCSYLWDILHAGPLSTRTELSTSLRKHAPAAPKSADWLQNHLRAQSVKSSECPDVSWTYSPTTNKLPNPTEAIVYCRGRLSWQRLLPLVIQLFLRVGGFLSIQTGRLGIFGAALTGAPELFLVFVVFGRSLWHTWLSNAPLSPCCLQSSHVGSEGYTATCQATIPARTEGSQKHPLLKVLISAEWYYFILFFYGEKTGL